MDAFSRPLILLVTYQASVVFSVVVLVGSDLFSVSAALDDLSDEPEDER
jgi:hypothetical protein